MANHIEIPFSKFHGLANDFIVAEARGLPGRLPQLARSICERHTGVGADGFLVVSPPRNRKHQARVRFFNADGSEAEMSGNGIRCVAALLLERTGTKGILRIETAAGVKSLHVVESEKGKWTFRVAMGRPILEPAQIPFTGSHSAGPVVGFPLKTSLGPQPVTVTSMGNPHCTVFVSDFAAVDWLRLGRDIEVNPLFPNRTNVEFVRVVSSQDIEVRFWERGVGETMSSGTGSCAAAVACVLNRRTGRQVRVRTPAGTLEVTWPARGEVSLTGPVELIARGTYHYRG
jgi:diaminopimelate epimerase